MHFSTASTIITFALAALTPLASAQAPNLDARDLAGLHQRGLDNLYERDVAALEALHKREFNVIDALYERDLENVHERDLLQPMVCCLPPITLRVAWLMRFPTTVKALCSSGYPVQASIVPEQYPLRYGRGLLGA